MRFTQPALQGRGLNPQTSEVRDQAGPWLSRWYPLQTWELIDLQTGMKASSAQETGVTSQCSTLSQMPNPSYPRCLED